ncbi:sugar transferase [Candidatus Pacearchaeota archaeon]|nr:sugar transferase [Candidatus Pacearchaeota archaeon]
MKRILDLFIISVLIPLVLPLGLLIALVIRIERNGPVFYRSRRIGRDGNQFDMLKFRTMYTDNHRHLSDEHYRLLNLNFKLVDDPRITPVGQWLRRTSLDELPQLINVIRGEMSLVGPRPKLPEEIDLFGKQKKELLSIAPGITGYWQVFRKIAASDATMRMMDLYYVRRRNISMDMWLLFFTPWLVMKGKNV